MLTVDQIKETVAGYFKDKPVKSVYLFGSYARGEAKEDSDVDLGIILQDVRMGIWQYVGLEAGLEEALNKKIDLVEISLMHSWVKRNFDKEKIEIYHA
jgi:predicted nucleotidyltransferase